jgi:ribosomal protein S12 methylthiotransferase accessory factor
VNPLPTNTTTAKTYFGGTHRTRAPEETWRIIEPKLARFGITRVADVTGLDAIGIPVMMAVRPLGKTLGVTQGKGQTPLLAKVSGVMEAIEDWHAEFAHPLVARAGTTSAELGLPYDIQGLPRDPDALLTESMTLDWVAATCLPSGRETFLPREVVCYDGLTSRAWTPSGLRWNSNGLASGNCVEEATLHGLYEITERDAISLLPSTGRMPDIDPDTVKDEACIALVGKIRAAGADVRLTHVPSRFGVPVFIAWIWSGEFALPMLGCGAHLAPEVALSRAITEAAQTRLTGIAASRDDLGPDLYDQVREGVDGLSAGPPATTRWADVADGFTVRFDDVNEELDWACAQVVRVTGGEPLLVDLSVDPDIAVVRVIVPGAVFDIDRVHPTAEFEITGGDGQCPT